MTASTTVRKIGTSAGIILSKNILSAMNCKIGDNLFVIKTPRGIEVAPYNSEFARIMESAREIMDENKNMFKKLGE